MNIEGAPELRNTEFLPKRMITGIRDPDYLKTLGWANNVKVINYIPCVNYEIGNLVDFRSRYLDRQLGLLDILDIAGRFIADNDLQTSKDIEPRHKQFLRDFVSQVGVFFSKTTFFGLSAKGVQAATYERLVRKYPHIDSDLLITPSKPPAPVLRLLSEAEYARGENENFVYQYCGGNTELAARTLKTPSSQVERQLREAAKENSIKKGYTMFGKGDIQLLDDLLVIDHTLENWIWKTSFVTAPLFHIYNLMQESIEQTGEFVKEKGYIFDLKLIREHF
ncbi:MAG: hypothetical protein XD98_0355 [Microgenomates bacterium 39_6]|nr:MAG: hypothetical protein XD98_0355 [Microgenomates bacterium 39_6]